MRTLLLLFACAVGCGAGTRPAAAPTGSSPLPPLPPPPKDPYAVRATPETPASLSADEAPSLTPIDRSSHLAAIEAAKAGRLHEAKRLLGRLAFAYPAEHVLVQQYNAVVAQMEARQQVAKTSLEAAPLRVLPAPPAKYELTRAAPVSEPIPKLVKTSERKNEIVDEEKWFRRNDISVPEYFVPGDRDLLFAPGVTERRTVIDTLSGFVYTEYAVSARYLGRPLPLEVPLSYGTLPLTRAIDSVPFTIAIYGQRVIAVFDDAHTVKTLFDLQNYVHPPASERTTRKIGEATLRTGSTTVKGDVVVDVESISHDLQFALARDGMLYVSHANSGYAKESRGQTAYVTAIELGTGEMLWRSTPLVSNTHAFALVGGAVVTGYGFTAEPDFLYVIDRSTGKTKQTVPLRTGPDYVIAKDDNLFVRTYDTDLVFRARP